MESDEHYAVVSPIVESATRESNASNKKTARMVSKLQTWINSKTILQDDGRYALPEAVVCSAIEVAMILQAYGLKIKIRQSKPGAYDFR